MAFDRLHEDIANILDKDPAARSAVEVLLCYPGLHAILWHRLAHHLWRQGFRTLPRFVALVSRWLTGIEIHPGAVIGRRVFIDHGLGVVIGETAVVGDDCTIYQGVTLGGTSLVAGTKRHPTLEAGVVVSAGAKVLGPFTVGAGARVGANAVVLKAVPPDTTAVGVPARTIQRDDRIDTDPDANVAEPGTAPIAAPARRPAPAVAEAGEGACAPAFFTAYGLVPGATDPVALALHRLIEHVAEQDQQIERLQKAVVALGGCEDRPCEKLDAGWLKSVVD